MEIIGENPVDDRSFTLFFLSNVEPNAEKNNCHDNDNKDLDPKCVYDRIRTLGTFTLSNSHENTSVFLDCSDTVLAENSLIPFSTFYRRVIQRVKSTQTLIRTGTRIYGTRLYVAPPESLFH